MPKNEIDTTGNGSLNEEHEGDLVAYFVRHGTTDGNAQGLFRGPLDYPLDGQGLKDAEKLRDYFANKPLGAAYSSDTQRASKTAEIVLEPKGMSASETSDLRSWNVGYLAGLPKSKHENDSDFFQNNENTIVPNGESLTQFRQRVQPRIKNSIASGVRGGVPSITFTHSSVIHELSHMLYGDHTYIKVKPGGAVGVFKRGNKFTARTLFGQSAPGKNQHYGS